MKRLIYIWVVFLFCVACERDLMSYEGEEAIYFAVQSGNSWGSERDWPYMPYSLAEFGSILEDTLTVRIKVMITGGEKDYPRWFKVVVNSDSTTAKEGVHYRTLADEYILDANSSCAYVPVLLYRQPEMKTDTVTLGLKLIANDYFSLTFDEFVKMDKFTNGSVVYDSFDATMHKILMTDIMPQPKQWSTWEFGTFTPKKLNLICQKLDYTYEDFQNDKKITYLQQMVISRKFSEILNQAYYDGEPILEDNGQLMWVSGCVYEQGTYSEGNK
ncbi:MAG: DUF4843 domain-containing protein [Oscillibacter sp.]|nr:DUF4843 domain-containing protein [Oscillibacter sp.]